MNRATIASTLLLAGLPGPVLAQATFTGLGFLDGSWGCYASSISADGQTVSGYCSFMPPGNTNHAFRWRAGVMHDLGVPAASVYSEGGPLNADGTIMVGMVGPGQRPARWTLASGAFQDLAFPANTSHVPFSISPDGSTVWGFGGSSPITPRVFRWTAATSVQYLPLLPGYPASSGGHTSADGSIVVGAVHVEDTYKPVRWINGVPNLLTLPPGYLKGNAADISADGQVIAGTIHTEFTWYMFRWTQSAGFQILGNFYSVGNAINADGSVIVGRDWSGAASRAAFWSAQTGMVDLTTYLTSHGVDLTDWSLDEAIDVSADGRTILGQGMHYNVPEGWIVRLPAPCLANCDASTSAPILNGNDFQCFLNLFASGHFRANCDGSTVQPILNANDFACFINAFAAGCS